LPQSLFRSVAIALCLLLACASIWAQAFEPGQTVEVFVHGNWGTVGRVKRVDASGVLVLYRAEDGTYNESTGFARYFQPTDVRPKGSGPGTPKGTASGLGLPSVPEPSTATKYKVGDRVEGWNIAWYKGTVVKVGVEGYAGYYLIKHDEFSQDSYYKEANVRALGASTSRPDAARAATPAAPLLGAGRGLATGTYGCGVFLSGRYTHTQTITLEGGRYTTTHGSGGRYSFDAATGRVEFQGGALADQVGRYEPDNNRIIRLTQRKDLGASEYTQKWRSQVCSPR
jgi:hypothetical protein